MYRFANIEALWMLAFLPVLWLIFLFVQRWRKRQLKKFADSSALRILSPDFKASRFSFKFILWNLALIALIIALANPQIGNKLEEVKRKGVDLVICLDLSNSMLAEDIKPNRLENAKRAITRLLEELRNDRIGIVVFGGEAYTQLPITTDYAAAKMFLNTVNTDIIPVQGTAIGKAIDMAMRSFDPESPTSKTIIVLTDGENHEDDAVKKAEEAANAGITVHTIGMGSIEGAPIPVFRGSKKTGFRKDANGNSVVTKLNEENLINVAQAGNGIFVRASSSNTGLDYIFNEIEQMEKTEFGSKMFTDYEDRFYYLTAIAFVLLVIESITLNRRNRWWASLNLFGEKND